MYYRGLVKKKIGSTHHDKFNIKKKINTCGICSTENRDTEIVDGKKKCHLRRRCACSMSNDAERIHLFCATLTHTHTYLFVIIWCVFVYFYGKFIRLFVAMAYTMCG